MFDEASDIQMHGNRNVFVNVCLYTGEVRTFTLALKGEDVHSCTNGCRASEPG